MKYTDLFIDFDETLYATHANANIALRYVFEQFNLHQYIPDIENFIAVYSKANTALWDKYAKGEIERDFLITERFRVPLCLGIENPSLELCKAFSDAFLARCATMPGEIEGAIDLLQYLKGKGYKLHICSNGFHEVQFGKLRASNMLEYFDNIILSEDVGINKPSPKFFEYAFQIANTTPSQSIMIGDSIATDIMGAINAGMDSIYFKRNNSNSYEVIPTYTVTSLDQIKNIL